MRQLLIIPSVLLLLLLLLLHVRVRQKLHRRGSGIDRNKLERTAVFVHVRAWLRAGRRGRGAMVGGRREVDEVDRLSAVDRGGSVLGRRELRHHCWWWCALIEVRVP